MTDSEQSGAGFEDPSGEAGAGDAGSDAGDAGAGDAGSDAGDAGGSGDGGGTDSGSDGGSGGDAGEAGSGDAGSTDSGSGDAGSGDGGSGDAGEAGSGDAGDAGSGDGGSTDSGSADGGGSGDAGDGGSTDSGSADGGGSGGDTGDGGSGGSDTGNGGGTDTGSADGGGSGGDTGDGGSDAGGADSGADGGSGSDAGGADGGGSGGDGGGGDAGGDAGGGGSDAGDGGSGGDAGGGSGTPPAGGPVSPGTKPAREMTKAEALAELTRLQTAKQIKFATSSVLAGHVDLDGLVPGTTTSQAGNVVGVIVRYWGSGLKAGAPPSGGNAPDAQDPRAAVALIRLCDWLKSTWGVTELYHAGVNGSTGRTDCHGQGRALDFVGVKGNHNGSDFLFTVYDDWGKVVTPHTPGGNWAPAGTSSTHFRLADLAPRPMAADFFQTFYTFVAGQYQDKSANPDPPTTPTSIGDHTFIMNPDHPTSKPGTPNGREAHQGHVHVQIGVTGTEP